MLFFFSLSLFQVSPRTRFVCKDDVPCSTRAQKKSRWLLRWQLAVRIWFANGAGAGERLRGTRGFAFFVDPWRGAGFLPVKSPAWPGATGSSLPYLVIVTITDFCSVWGSFRYALSSIMINGSLSTVLLPRLSMSENTFTFADPSNLVLSISAIATIWWQ